MFNGKMKALTFSYDDGVTQDEKLIALFDKYGMKATFNLNSALLGRPGSLLRNGFTISHNKVTPETVKSLYKNHEVAVHTCNHYNLTTLSDEDVVYQVKNDREALSRLCGYEVTGMAYPCGGVNNDDRVAKVIADNVPQIKYSRTITSSHNFDLQTNLLRFNPTVYHLEFDKLVTLADEFLALKPDTPKLFYIWGHSYEFDGLVDMTAFEEVLKKLAFRDDIFYGTNREVLG